MEKYLNYNGKIYLTNEPVLISSDHSYRYGDGLFETMKIKDGKIFYWEKHFERLFLGLQLLKFEIPGTFTSKKISDEILGLCRTNNWMNMARVRLSISRGKGGVYDCDNKMSYLIECWPLIDQDHLNETGLIIDIFPDARKSADIFSNIKSSNYLPYIIAANWAKEKKLNDALILNHHQRICDATIANVFWVKDDNIFTPPLSEGCIAGVMRRKILDHESLGFLVKEQELTELVLLNADEVFLTNVITGIRWVKQCCNKNYQNTITSKISEELAQTISS